MDPTVFYAWQSDAPNSCNRSFIENSIKKAIKGIAESIPLEVPPRFDKDTLGESGAVDVANTIYGKIDACMAFIADVSLVGSISRHDNDPKRVPNPNVMLELGYAARSRGWSRVIPVMNTAYGSPDELPFDLKHKRWPIIYSVQPDTPPEVKAAEAKNVVAQIEREIRTIMAQSAESFGLGESEARDMMEQFFDQVRTGSFAGMEESPNGALALFVVPANRREVPLTTEAIKAAAEGSLLPIGAGGSWRVGGRFHRVFATHSYGAVHSATEITTDGVVRGATCRIYADHENFEVQRLPGGYYVREALQGIADAIGVLMKLGFSGPFYVAVALLQLRRSIIALDVEEYTAVEFAVTGDEIPGMIRWQPQGTRVDIRELGEAMRPIFEHIWRDFGARTCPPLNKLIGAR